MKSECSHSVTLAQRMCAEYCASNRLKVEVGSSGVFGGGSEAKQMRWMVSHSAAVFASKTKHAAQTQSLIFDTYSSVTSQVSLLQGRF